MDILETVLDAQGGGAVRQIASQFGLDERQAQSAIAALLPSLAGAATRNASTAGGIESLLGALGSGNHRHYLDDPSSLGDPTSAADGNNILGHLFGSKEVSREVASRASQQTGIGADILKQMLPLVAGLLMGGLSKRASTGGLQGAPGSAAAGGGLLDMLTPMLDRNGDGNVVDDVLGMAGRFMGRR